jgi:hypothetical protein
MDRTSASLLAAAVVFGLAAHGAFEMAAAREAARQPRPDAGAAAPSDPGEAEARDKHRRRQEALREKELADAAAQRQWERAYWDKVFDEARFLARNKAQAGKYQVVRVEGQDVFLLDTATGEVTKKALSQ